MLLFGYIDIKETAQIPIKFKYFIDNTMIGEKYLTEYI